MTDSKRIAFFMPSFRGGGAERVTLLLAEAFGQRGYHVDLLIVNAEGPLREAVPKEVSVLNFGKSRTLNCLLPLASYLRQQMPESLVCTMVHVGLVGITASLISGVAVRVILAVHGVASRNKENTSTLKRKIIAFCFRKIFNKAHAIIAVSQGTAVDFADYFGIARERISVISNPVITKDFKKKASEYVFHNWFNQSKIPVLISIGRLNPIKDYETLIRAFAEVRKLRETYLVILGEGELRSKLLSLIRHLNLQDSVQLLGFVSNPLAYLEKSDLFVISSISESFCMAIVEALELGVKIVSTDCPFGPREILQQGKYGRLVPIRNVQLLAKAMLQTLDEPRPNIDTSYTQQYKVDTVARQYENVIFNPD